MKLNGINESNTFTLYFKVLFIMESENKETHLEDLSEIRSMMERSSTFISLSGLSGIVAGLIALVGSGLAYYRLESFYRSTESLEIPFANLYDIRTELITDFILIACVVLVSAIVFGLILTARQARKKGQQLWGSTSKRLFLNLAIPLITGGIFCLILIHHGIYGIAAPASLMFYGLALVNASKYTLRDIRMLGYIEIALGLLASFFIGNGLLFWAIGFGVMHIVYGTIMYFKYDKNA